MTHELYVFLVHSIYVFFSPSFMVFPPPSLPPPPLLHLSTHIMAILRISFLSSLILPAFFLLLCFSLLYFLILISLSFLFLLFLFLLLILHISHLACCSLVSLNIRNRKKSSWSLLSRLGEKKKCNLMPRWLYSCKCWYYQSRKGQFIHLFLH